MTDGVPTFVILRKNVETVANVKEKIKDVLSNEGRLEIISDKGIIADDAKFADFGEVVYYLFIQPFTTAKIQKMQKIGSGSYGTVYPCTISGGCTGFALKKIKMEYEDDLNKRADVISEILVASRIDSHVRIMKYFGFYENKGKFYIRMDLMKQSLSAYVRGNKQLTEKTIKRISKQIFEGLEHLHDNKVIHRDIKGDNVLLDEFENAKLSDFGISKCLDVVSSQAGEGGANTKVGTWRYLAPEVVTPESSPYGYKCDIWSVGATMVEMITGNIPFHQIEEQAHIAIKLFTEKRIPFEYPDDFTSEIKEFVASCLTADPTKRPDCKELLLDKFLCVENK